MRCRSLVRLALGLAVLAATIGCQTSKINSSGTKNVVSADATDYSQFYIIKPDSYYSTFALPALNPPSGALTLNIGQISDISGKVLRDEAGNVGLLLYSTGTNLIPKSSPTLLFTGNWTNTTIGATTDSSQTETGRIGVTTVSLPLLYNGKQVGTFTYYNEILAGTSATIGGPYPNTFPPPGYVNFESFKLADICSGPYAGICDLKTNQAVNSTTGATDLLSLSLVMH